MSDLDVARLADGSLAVSGIRGILAELMRQLPGLLGADQPEAVRRRLYPDPTDDEETAAEWRRAQHPELFALLADSKQIVEYDLLSLRREPVDPSEAPDPAEDGDDALLEPQTWTLTIPAAHVNAWISAINAGRLVLGSLHEVTAADLSPDREPTYDERGLVILRIDLYAWLQGTLIEAVSPEE